jgi:hypothetical protein
MEFFRKTLEFFKRKFNEAKTAIQNDPKIILEKVRIISFISIIFIMSIAGIYFILKADQELTSKMWQVTDEIKKMGDKDANGNPIPISQAVLIGKSKSFGLMIAIILAFSSAIVSAFSESKKSNLILVYSLKAIALILAVGFVVFMFKFDTEFLTARGIKMFAEFKTTSIVLGFIGVAALATNIASNAILGIEE